MNLRKNKTSRHILDLLKLIAHGIDLLASARNPYRALEILGLSESNPIDRKRDYHRFHYLKRHGFIRDTKGIALTAKGRRALHISELQEIILPKYRVWDGKWHMILFDIPNDKSNQRLAFQHKLKTLGCKLFQKSVWIYPFECLKEINQLRKFYEIPDYVTYLTTEQIEDEGKLKKRFHLT